MKKARVYLIPIGKLLIYVISTLCLAYHNLVEGFESIGWK